MKVRQTIINKVDLEKLLKDKGLSLNQLSKHSGVDLAILSKAKNGKIILSENCWNKIKFFI
jgi:DNA-binding Xre family transcriptional regulator